MDRRSITQEYYTLAVDKNGNMPPTRREDANGGLVVAGLMDLLLGHIIAVENKKITVIGKLPEELAHLSGLYDYLNEKTHGAIRMMSDYSAGKRMDQLIVATGKSLLAEGLADIGDGGIFVNRPTYIPRQNYKDALVHALKAATADGDALTAHDAALVCILKGSKNLNQYYTKNEMDEMKEKLAEMEKNPEKAQLMKMINYVRHMSEIFMLLLILIPVV